MRLPEKHTAVLQNTAFLTKPHFQPEDFKGLGVFFSDFVAAEAAAAFNAGDPVFRAELVIFGLVFPEGCLLLIDGIFDIHIQARLEGHIGPAGGGDRLIEENSRS